MEFYKENCLQDFEITSKKFMNQYDVEQENYFIVINSLEDLLKLIKKTDKETNHRGIILSERKIVIYDGYYE